ARSIEYLGHELSNEGVRPLQRLVTAVQEFPTPCDAVGVKRFVLLPGYYQRFVQGFGSLMAPLTKRVRKKV
ncbi:RNA-dependent DNA polymerase, partial [Phytophthora megakarya]